MNLATIVLAVATPVLAIWPFDKNEEPMVFELRNDRVQVVTAQKLRDSERYTKLIHKAEVVELIFQNLNRRLKRKQLPESVNLEVEITDMYVGHGVDWIESHVVMHRQGSNKIEFDTQISAGRGIGTTDVVRIMSKRLAKRIIVRAQMAIKGESAQAGRAARNHYPETVPI